MGKILRFALRMTPFGVVILNPSAVLRINSVKDLILKLSHYSVELFLNSSQPREGRRAISPKLMAAVFTKGETEWHFNSDV